MSNGNRGFPQIGTGFDDFGAGLTKLGDALAGVIDPEADARDQILKAVLSTPTLLANIADSQRQLERQAQAKAKETGKPQPLPNALAAFGITDAKFAQFVSRLDPETSAELLARLTAKEEVAAGIPKKLADVKKGQLSVLETSAEIQLRTNQFALAQGHPEIAAELAIVTDKFNTEQFRETSRILTDLKGKNPELYAEAILSSKFPEFIRAQVTKRGQDIDEQIRKRSNEIAAQRNAILAAKNKLDEAANLAKLKADLALQEMQILEVVGNKDLPDSIRIGMAARFNDISETADQMFGRTTGVRLKATKVGGFLGFFKELDFDMTAVERVIPLGDLPLERALSVFALSYATNSDLTLDEAVRSDNGQAIITRLGVAHDMNPAEATNEFKRVLVEMRAKSPVEAQPDAPRPFIQVLTGPGGDLPGDPVIRINPEFVSHIIEGQKRDFRIVGEGISRSAQRGFRTLVAPPAGTENATP